MRRFAAGTALVLKSGAAALEWATRISPAHGWQLEALDLLVLQSDALSSVFLALKSAEQRGDVAAASAAAAAAPPQHVMRWLAAAAGMLQAREALRSTGKAPCGSVSLRGRAQLEWMVIPLMRVSILLAAPPLQTSTQARLPPAL